MGYPKVDMASDSDSQEATFHAAPFTPGWGPASAKPGLTYSNNSGADSAAFHWPNGSAGERNHGIKVWPEISRACPEAFDGAGRLQRQFSHPAAQQILSQGSDTPFSWSRVRRRSSGHPAKSALSQGDAPAGKRAAKTHVTFESDVSGLETDANAAVSRAKSHFCLSGQKRAVRERARALMALRSEPSQT
eukprot:scaffold14051_cov40-Prasinocladus_malaysianus.AAC.2